MKRKPFPLELPFTKADLRLPVVARMSRRNSISGVQSKVLLSMRKGRLEVVESGGEYILKPVPENTRSRFPSDIPANEHLTMKIASELFGIETAENACIRFADGELAYITRRFDRRDGVPVRQEDLCQIAGRSEETHGEGYKYDFSYEEMSGIIRSVCSASRIELAKVFNQLVFDYVFGNGDAHLKNFSVFESELGDYVMTPAYDLLNTLLHYPGDLTFMALSLFKDPDYMTPEFEKLGYYTSADFVVLGAAYGLSEKDVKALIGKYTGKSAEIERMVRNSLLSSPAQEEYLKVVNDRVAMIGR